LAGESIDALHAQISANRRRVAWLLAAFAGLLLVVVWPIAAVAGLGWLGLVPALLVAGGLTAIVHTRADGVAQTRLGAIPADAKEHARFHNVVDGLCVAAGVPKPRLLVVVDDAPNACSIGRDPRRAAVVATSGLLDKLTRIELEGVVAHELSHIKTHDTAVATLAVMVGMVAPALVPRAVGRGRETLADVTGVALTRYPPGLISALEKLRDDPSVLRTSDRAIAHLWIEAPSAALPYPPLDERIQALREL
jgi:heat shock protein HtpX